MTPSEKEADACLFYAFEERLGRDVQLYTEGFQNVGRSRLGRDRTIAVFGNSAASSRNDDGASRRRIE
jgi:hypothetical protein